MLRKIILKYLVLVVLFGGSFINQSFSQDKSIILQSTTSTVNSGLYDYLLPLFKKKTGITVNVVAVGTGQAIKNVRNGDGDVLIVHAKKDEERFVKDGYGVKRYDLMYNDFVIIGPAFDQKKMENLKTVTEVMRKIASTQTIFVSRGDNSGTHKKEITLWQSAGIDPSQFSGKWYREAGTGMGATLNTAVGMNAYTLTDRGTWISFQNKQKHKILFQGHDNLFNQYGIILVNPLKHPRVKAEEGQIFIDWLIGSEGQNAIARYRIDGQQLFFPNARSDF